MSDGDVSELEPAVVRFERLEEYSDAYMDAVLPGHSRRFRVLVGPELKDEHGVTASDVQPAVVDDRLWVEILTCAPGNGPALHAHDIQEAFMPLTGTWTVCWGNHGEHHAELGPHDLIIIPAQLMHSCSNAGGDDASLLAVSWESGGSVTYAPEVVEQLRRAGRVVDPTHEHVSHGATPPIQ
jgi:uncharacterized RmlC-like cupin family protein